MMSPSSLSVSLKQLERSIGVTLFVRRAGEGVTLTPEGADLIVRARSLLVQAEEMRILVNGHTAGAHAPIVVGSLVTVAPLVLPRLVRRFRMKHRDAVIDIRTGSQSALLESIVDGSLHAVVTYDLGMHDRIIFEPLVTASPWVVLRSDHRLATRSSLSIEELVGEPYVAIDLPMSREYFASVFVSKGLDYLPSFRATELDMVRSLVGNGLGWSMVNLKPPTSAAIDGARVRYVPLKTDHPPLLLGLATLADRRHPASASAFMEFVREELIGLFDEPT